MIALSQTERRAIEKAAREARASRTAGTEPHAVITLAGRTIAVTIAAVRQSALGGAGRARLRDDRVARRFVPALEAALGAGVPEDRTAILTHGAPIKVPNRTLAALTKTISGRLDSRAADRDERLDVLGNRLRFRLLGEGSAWTSKAVAFVVTGDPHPGDLAEAMRSLRQAIVAAAQTSPGDRFALGAWLVLTGDWIADIKTYRRAFAYLSVPHRFEKVLMLYDGARIERLAG